MASYHEVITTVTLPGGEDLQGDLYSLVTLNTSGQVVKTTAATQVIIGVLAENPDHGTVGLPVTVALVGTGGVMPIKAGAAIGAGRLITIDATDAGKASSVAALTNLAADQMAAGMSLAAAGAEDEAISCLLMPLAGS